MYYNYETQSDNIYVIIFYVTRKECNNWDYVYN